MESTPKKSTLVFVPPPVSSQNELNAEASRRLTPRRPYRRTTGLLVGGSYAVFEGRSISEGGIGVTMSESSHSKDILKLVKVGAPVVVSLILPSGAVLILRGEIIHHGNEKSVGHSVGIKFEGVLLHQRREIRYYVSAKPAGEAEAI